MRRILYGGICVNTLSKKLRKQMRELVGLAYERELNQSLADLAHYFDEWRQNTIDGFQLNDCIHQFHHGKSREIFGMYGNAGVISVHLLIRAIHLKLLKKEDMSEELWQVIACDIEKMD